MEMETSFYIFLCVSLGTFAAKADGVEAVSATEGESVTLPTGVTWINSTDLVQWKFEPNMNCLATVCLQNIHIYDSICDKTFRDKLQFDNQTGSLTINNIRTTDSGLYNLTVYRQQGVSHKIFRVTVEALDTPSQWWISVPVLVLAALGGSVMFCCWKNKRKAAPNKPEEQELQEVIIKQAPLETSEIPSK